MARAEWVSEIVRENGLDAAITRFGGSGHAIEQATLVAAAVQGDRLELTLVVDLLDCEIDDLVAYGSFLELLQQFRATHGDEALASYERFCTAFSAKASNLPHWGDRVGAVRDGLAGFYVTCGRFDRGHDLFLERHQEDPGTILVALAASRAFWSAGATSRAIAWLGMGADRATDLGRGELANRLCARSRPSCDLAKASPHFSPTSPAAVTSAGNLWQYVLAGPRHTAVCLRHAAPGVCQIFLGSCNLATSRW